MFVKVSCECGKKTTDQFFRRVVPPETVEAKCLVLKEELTKDCMSCSIARHKAKTEPKKKAFKRPVIKKGKDDEDQGNGQ